MNTEFQKQIDLAVGRKIRIRRKLLGLSRTQLALHLEVSTQQIQKYEAGMTSLKVYKLLQIARALQVDANWFFDQEFLDDDQRNDVTYTLMNDDNIARLVTCYLKIDQAAQIRLVEFMTSMTKTNCLQKINHGVLED
jgi:transcriptional regulator with XRE-family HTH domain